MDVDPTLIRLVWVLLVFFGGTGGRSQYQS
ncbi:MAG: PspC domain-containing protein [Hyphomicrobiaceae bacterium]